MATATQPRRARRHRLPSAEDLAERIARATAPGEGAVLQEVTPTTPVKIIAQVWTNHAGQRVFVAEIQPDRWAPCIEGQDGALVPFSDGIPRLSFDVAQVELDELASRKGWSSNVELPEDDPEPKPTRRANTRTEKEEIVATKSATSTKKRTKKRGTNGTTGPGMFGRGPGQNGESAPGRVGSLAPSVVAQATIDVAKVDPSPFQPRMAFPEEEIRALADSIDEDGQLQPILVRPKGKRWELVDGERRLRAMKLLGLKQIRAEYQCFTDAQARRIVLVSALQRADLSAIEEARAFRASLDAGDFSGPTELAAALGLSQGHVSNRLRLLELPDEWQARVISHEMPATHARALVKIKDHPKVLKVVAAHLKRDQGDPGTVAAFEDTVDRAIMCTGFTLREKYDSTIGKHVPAMQPTDEQRARLNLVEVNGWGGKKWEVALNTALANNLHAQHLKEWLAKQKEQKKKQGAKRRKASPAKKPTPAERKRREEEAARKFAKDLWEWYVDWTCHLIATRLEDASWSDVEKVMLFLLADTDGDWLRAEKLRLGLEAAGVKVKGGSLLAGLAELSELDLGPVTIAVVAACFWDRNEGPVGGHDMKDEDVLAAARIVGVSHETEWLEDQGGDLSERYWDLHHREQLFELAAELEVSEVQPAMNKPEIVKMLLSKRPDPDAKDVGLPMPKELKKIKRPKR